MARVNKANLHGQVCSVPRITANNQGEETSAMFSVKVLRRPTNGQGFDSKLYIDCPIVRTRDPKMISAIRDLELGDMVDVCGVITTRETRKSSNCPSCGKKNITDGVIVFVTPIYICKRESKVDDVQALALLKQRSEISNSIQVVGNVCKTPHFYEDAVNKTYAQYQLAVNRRYRIREDADDVKTDYPWIKTFGKQALEDSRCLRIGSNVLIDGALQTRKIIRKTLCLHCGEMYEWPEAVMEIVPYYIGYLANCDTNAEDAETEEITVGDVTDLRNGEGDDGKEKRS